MVSKESRQKVREKKHLKIRNRFSGTPERPRLAVFRSNNHMPLWYRFLSAGAGKIPLHAAFSEREREEMVVPAGMTVSV